MIKLDKNTIKFSVVLLVICIPLLFPAITKASILYLLPQSQTIYQEDSFVVTVMVDTEGEDINAIEGYLSFSQDRLEIIDIESGGAILNLWPKEPSYSNQTGEVDFIGGIPRGFQGQGKLLSIIFRVNPRVVPPESASITFKENSKVLLNDGKGTETELNFLAGNYEIIEKPEGLPVISSRTHPDQNRWYRGKTLHLHWDLIEGAEYSYLLSHDALAEPDEIPDKPEGELIWMGDMEYQGLEDGIYYFHLRQATRDKQQELRWGPKISFRAMIDATPPEEFEPQIAEIERKKYLVFATDDKTSGIEYYEVKEGKRDFKRAKSPYLLEDQSLRRVIKVKAIDKAGNERIAEIVPPYKITWKDIVIILAILIGIGTIWWIIRARRDKRQETRDKQEGI